MKRALDLDILFGGYYAGKDKSEKYTLFRLLDFGREVYHAALYDREFDRVPTLQEIAGLAPHIGHVPCDSRDFFLERDLQLIGGVPLVSEDFEGYRIYWQHHGAPEHEIEALIADLMG